MIEYDIKILTINDVDITFDTAYLVHNDDLIPQTWGIDIFRTNNDNFFENIYDEELKPIVKIATMDGSSFVGEALIKKYVNGPLGSDVFLEGNKELIKVQAAPK